MKKFQKSIVKILACLVFVLIANSARACIDPHTGASSCDTVYWACMNDCFDCWDCPEVINNPGNPYWWGQCSTHGAGGCWNNNICGLPATERQCGDTCCRPWLGGETCCNGVCCAGECINGTCCTWGQEPCGDTCCSDGEVCLGGNCCPSSQVCGGVCCSHGECCGNVCYTDPYDGKPFSDGAGNGEYRNCRCI